MKYNFEEYKLAVFDLDGTLTYQDTLKDFSIFLFKNCIRKKLIFYFLLVLLKLKIIDNKKFKILYAKFFLKDLKQIEKLSQEWFEIKGKKLIRTEFLNENFKKFENKIIISSNFEFLVKLFAKHLNMKNYFAINLDKLDKIPYKNVKAEILLNNYSKDFLKNYTIAFGNDEGDYEMLKIVKKGILIRTKIE